MKKGLHYKNIKISPGILNQKPIRFLEKATTSNSPLFFPFVLCLAEAFIKINFLCFLNENVATPWI